MSVRVSAYVLSHKTSLLMSFVFYPLSAPSAYTLSAHLLAHSCLRLRPPRSPPPPQSPLGRQIRRVRHQSRRVLRRRGRPRLTTTSLVLSHTASSEIPTTAATSTAATTGCRTTWHARPTWSTIPPRRDATTARTSPAAERV